MRKLFTVDISDCLMNHPVTPDLILVDGGEDNLVCMAISALRKLGLDYIPIVGLAKRLKSVCTWKN